MVNGLSGLVVLLIALLLVPAVGAVQSEHGIMHPSQEQLRSWSEAYAQAPAVTLAPSRMRGIMNATGSQDLLPFLDYTPEERDQGWSGNCWAWAGTGVMEIAHSVQDGVRDRLSIEYLDANFHSPYPDNRWAGDGGYLTDFTEFYSTSGMAVPWSNPNAQYQDGVQWCVDNGRSLVPAYAIGTEPHYQLRSIEAQRIPTRHVGQAEAIARIKAVLDDDRGVWFAYYLPNSSAWNAFYIFWVGGSENGTAWDPDPWVNTAWNDQEGGGHAVVCVGYNDTDPENRYWVMLNSWGTTAGRPNGLFRVSMDMDYDASVRMFDQDCASMLWMTEKVEFGPMAVPTPRAIEALPYAITEPGEYYLTRDFKALDASRAIEVRASTVVLDGRGHTVDAAAGTGQYGLLVYRAGGSLANVTVRNLALSDWDEGAAFYNVTGGRLEDAAITGSTFAGVSLDGGTTGVSVLDSRLGANQVGLFIRNSHANVVGGNTIDSSVTAGLSLYSAGGNRIADNRLSNTRNLLVGGVDLPNVWNTTKTSETNVVGGPYTGGNYWGSPDRRGWSDRAYDTDHDGIGDEPFDLTGKGTNVDALPLVGYAMPAPVAVPPGASRPTDPDGDRLYEDVNGNGRFDFADVVLFFNSMEWIADHEPVQLFDYNRNLRIDFGDVVRLFETLG